MVAPKDFLSTRPVLPLRLNTLRLMNVARAHESYPACHRWTPSDWMNALVGEVGETANMLKKLSIPESYTEAEIDALWYNLGGELADILIYLDLLCAKLNIDLGAAVIQKFNEVSARPKVNSPRRLLMPSARLSTVDALDDAVMQLMAEMPLVEVRSSIGGWLVDATDRGRAAIYLPTQVMEQINRHKNKDAVPLLSYQRVVALRFAAACAVFLNETADVAPRDVWDAQEPTV